MQRNLSAVVVFQNMGSYAAVPELDDAKGTKDSEKTLGETLSGRFADVDIDSVAAVQEQREP